MSEFKSFASLTPSLLARKGAARPAMRPQLQPMPNYRDALARAFPPGEMDDHALNDLGWNDMGHEAPEAETAEVVAPEAPASAEAVEAAPEAAEPVAAEPVVAAAPEMPVSVAPVSEVPAPVARLVPLPRAKAPAVATPPQRRNALSEGRRAAFTLRLDAERHLQLRLACTIAGRSAQQLIIEALDSLIAAHPHVVSLAEQVRDKR